MLKELAIRSLFVFGGPKCYRKLIIRASEDCGKVIEYYEIVGAMENIDLTQLHDRLKWARLRAGYKTAVDAAKALGLAYPTYAGHEGGKTGIRHQAATKYALKYRVSLEWLLTGAGDVDAKTTGAIAGKLIAREMMNDGSSLPVLGVIRAGHWLDLSAVGDDVPESYLPLLPDPRHTGRQYALRVEGTSMNKIFPDGSYAQCVDFAESGLSIKSGMIAHIERRHAQLTEITLKKIERSSNKWWLVPVSTDPKWTPVEFDADDDTNEVVIRGVAVGLYKPI